MCWQKNSRHFPNANNDIFKHITYFEKSNVSRCFSLPPLDVSNVVPKLPDPLQRYLYFTGHTACNNYKTTPSLRLLLAHAQTRRDGIPPSHTTQLSHMWSAPWHMSRPLAIAVRSRACANGAALYLPHHAGLHCTRPVSGQGTRRANFRTASVRPVTKNSVCHPRHLGVRFCGDASAEGRWPTRNARLSPSTAVDKIPGRGSPPSHEGALKLPPAPGSRPDRAGLSFSGNCAAASRLIPPPSAVPPLQLRLWPAARRWWSCSCPSPGAGRPSDPATRTGGAPLCDPPAVAAVAWVAAGGPPCRDPCLRAGRPRAGSAPGWCANRSSRSGASGRGWTGTAAKGEREVRTEKQCGTMC